jgi:hypothetical protein
VDDEPDERQHSLTLHSPSATLLHAVCTRPCTQGPQLVVARGVPLQHAMTAANAS